MAESTLPAHWQFACGQAFAGLRELVHAFDFSLHAGKHAFAGVDPAVLLKVVDGFLGEPDGVVLEGDRADLQRLRVLLIDRIQPAHEQGLAAGRRHWQKEGVYGALATEALHDLAFRLAPEEQVLRGWFAEGFCVAYSREEMNSLRPRQTPKHPPSGAGNP